MTRNISFDIVRALCALEIIAYWHLFGYLSPDYTFLISRKGEGFTYIAIACFTFMSGFFLSKYEINSLADFKYFYFKRFKRFYVLFFISVLTLYFGFKWFVDTKQLIFTLTGLSPFILPEPLTIWYFSMIIGFYFFTPFILIFNNRLKQFTAGIVIFSLFIIMHTFVSPIDDRVLLYFPFYVLGLILPKSIVEIPGKFKYLCLLLTATLLAVLFYNFGSLKKTFLIKYLFTSIGLISVLSLSSIIALTPIAKIFSLISYASMVAYLFHRQAYIIFKKFIHNQDGSIPLFAALFVLLPAVFVISYYIQKSYDLIVNRLESKARKS